MTDTANSPSIEVDVLIIGTGPAGASLASFLGSYGVSGLMISRDKHTAFQPRAHIMNLATLECLRDIGLEKEFRQVSMSKKFYGDYRYCFSLAGRDITRMHSFGCAPTRLGDYLEASPCEHCDVSQNVGEPILHKFATQHGFQSRFNCKFLRYEEDQSTGLITTFIEDQFTGRTFQVVSKYLCGADGANSKVARQAGLNFDTVSGGAAALNVWYEADLSKYYEHDPGMLHQVLAPHLEAPAWCVSGISRVVRPYSEFVMGMMAHPSVTTIEATDEEIIKRLRELIGDDEVEIKIKGIYRWRINESVAQTISKGNIFCLGDAIHRHSPGKGLGANTSMQDAYNLAWKLAYVLQGKAGPGILGSYNSERQPVAKRVVRSANDTFRLAIALQKASGVTEPTVATRMAALRELEEVSPAGEARRYAVKKAREALYDENSALGAEMNQAYNSNAVYLHDEVDPNPAWPIGSAGVQRHIVSTYPGSRLPHAWLGTGRRAEKISTHDLAGKGGFTLFTGISGDKAWRAAAKAAVDALGGNVPVTVRSIGYGMEYSDMYLAWEDRREVEDSGVLLVRPDRTVAWRCKALPREGVEEKLITVLRSILCR